MRKRIFWYDTEFIECPNTIDLISIGIVGEDGSEFYACNSECDLDKASNWVKENVINLLPPRDSKAWMTHSEIRDAMMDFLKPTLVDPVEFWGYYPSYDHVVYCWLFGTMAELPSGMPKVTYDIKQLAMSVGNPTLPEQTTSKHDALEDAKWTKKAYEFLKASVRNRR